MILRDKKTGENVFIVPAHIVSVKQTPRRFVDDIDGKFFFTVVTARLIYECIGDYFLLCDLNAEYEVRNLHTV